jgi:hypothetical protein
MDPETGRVTEVYANAAYCRLAGGASVAEHLQRVAARRLPEHVTQLDYLCRCVCVFVCLCVCVCVRACVRACARPISVWMCVCRCVQVFV